MIEFEKASYRSQVLRLRKLAVQALKRFPISVKSVLFINHGENATFRIQAKNGKNFLFRIHRGGYHTDAAILEELLWLKQLEKKKIRAPRPVRSKNGRYIEVCGIESIGRTRQCVLFEWIDGHFLEKSIRPKHMFELGQLIAQVQMNAPSARSKHRVYWDANGLVGTKPKFGSVENLLSIDPKDQRSISRVRPLVYQELKKFERRHPHRMGTIHADLHFGNLVQTSLGLCPIDFDDSGFGFRAYDLVIPLLSAERSLGPKRAKDFLEARSALIDGYRSIASFDSQDEAMLKHLTAARKIAMLGWLNSRSDNPRLAKYLKDSAKAVAEYLNKSYPARR